MDTPLSRRRVIEAGGVGAALSLAGCSSLGSQSSSDDSAARVTVFAGLDEAELESYQQEVQQQVQDGEMERQEAQMRLQQRRAELLAESVAAFEERAAENDDLTVDDTTEQAGVLLVEGTPAAIVETLGYEEVHGLLAEAAYEEYSQQPEASGGDSGASDESADGGNESASGGNESDDGDAAESA